MEEKKLKNRNSLRTFFGGRLYFNSLFRKSNSSFCKSIFLGNRGFTLIELTVTIGIIGILTLGTITLINPSQVLKRSRDADRKSDLKQMQVSLEIYRADQGLYPSVSGVTVVGNCPASAPTSLVELDSDGSCPVDPTKIFLQLIPKDPKTKTNYYYLPNASANGYTIYSCLENANDTDKLTLTSIPAIPSAGIITALACPTGTTVYYGIVNQ